MRFDRIAVPPLLFALLTRLISFVTYTHTLMLISNMALTD